MLKDHFRKNEDLLSEQEDAGKKKRDGKKGGIFSAKKPQVPDGMFRKCEFCKKVIYEEDIQNAYNCCPECGRHFRTDPRTRIRLTVDKNSFEEWDAELVGKNPLSFPGYEEKLETLQENTGLREAVVTGKARIGGRQTAIGVMSADFLMGSMGTAVGEKITRMVERATKEKLPVIIFCCSGGARMQEGIFSLMQMAKTAQALKRHDEAGLLYISVLTDPTTGGVTASFAMLGDVILAEPEAMIGFAGARVIKQTIGGKLPEGFQSAEFLQKHGFVDRIVRRDQMRRVLKVLLRSSEACGRETDVFGGAAGCGRDSTYAGKTDAAGHGAAGVGNDAADFGHDATYAGETTVAAGEAPDSGRDAVSDDEQNEAITPWERVLAARDGSRPYSSDYISQIFDGFLELRGDRLYGDDRAVIGGIAAIGGQYVTVIGQQKGRNAKENRHRNFGMMNPEGYRKALRLMKQAEKFGRPVILFVDTPGAFCGIEAEERGQGEAIARNLFEMASLTVPVLSVVIGEGGSGGALALAMANEVWMLENSVYSILSPEGFAAILWKDGKKAPEAAGVMGITAGALKEAGIVEKVIPERVPAKKEEMDEIAAHLRTEIEAFLKRYQKKSPDEIAAQRYERFRRMGAES